MEEKWEKGGLQFSKMSLSFLISSFSYLNHGGDGGKVVLVEMVLEFKLCFFMSIELTWDGGKRFGYICETKRRKVLVFTGLRL